VKRLLHGKFLFTGVSPLQRDAGLVIQGDRILASGDAHALRRDYPDAEQTDFGAAILLPGLVNPHAHLELSHRRACELPNSFADWVLALRSSLTTGRDIAGTAIAAMRDGITQSLTFGVTTIGDITNFPQQQRSNFANAPIRLASFGEIRGMARRRLLAGAMIAAAIDSTGFVSVGLSPHAPYSVEPRVYLDCLQVASKLRLPLMTHLAELPYEEEFLAHHTGPLRELWGKLGGWDEHVPTVEGGPIRLAQSLGLLDYDRTILAHVNYCNDAELDLLARGRASVVYCPRTHAYFGHPPHRWREMLARGINVAVGTDSTASSPDLNLVDDLRLLHRIAPEHPVEDLWRMATTRAARALGWGLVGSLEAGSCADVVVFGVQTDDPLREILAHADRKPQEVFVGGVRRASSP
jgi:cytosine/adenosine deaminase-related metal-dependent hydrolase